MKQLSREEKLQRIALLEEKRRRELTKKPEYVPNAGQLPIHQCKSLNRFVFSGNGAGKSTALVNELIWILKGYNPIQKRSYPVGMRVVLIVDNSKKVDSVILTEMRKWFDLPDEWLKREGKPYTSKIQNERAEISIYTTEMSEMLAEGTSLHEVFADEPIPRHLYIAFKRSLRLKDYPGRFTFMGTPISEPWLRNDIYVPWSRGELPDTECFRMSSYVNIENLGKEGVESFVRALSDAERATRIEGSFFDSDALALQHLWKRDVHIVPSDKVTWNPKWPVVVGLDPHYSKPHVAVMVGADPDNHQLVLKELSLKSTAREFGARLAEWIEGHHVVDIVCDSLGSAEITGNEGFNSFIDVVTQVLRAQRKPGVRPTRYSEKDHEDLIDRLQTGLLIPDMPDNFGRRIPKLRVVSSCTGLIENIESVGWQKNRHTQEIKPKLDTSQKDFLSALGYALAANVTFSRDKAAPVYLKQSPYRGLSLRHEHRIRRR